MYQIRRTSNKANMPKEVAGEKINHGPTIVIHGGAGVIDRKSFPENKQKEYLDALKESLLAGYEILRKGGNCPFFNAGKGSVFTISGKNELEASIMLGIDSHTAGACTLLKTVKNPIILAKTLLQDPENPHVFLGGIEAEKYAKSKGLEMVDPGYFWTQQRWKQHLDGLEKKTENPKMLNDLDGGTNYP
ncbi:5407_t:CDS:2, partial [Scutellospora calospora]